MAIHPILCEAHREEGKAFDHWEGSVNYSIEKPWFSLFIDPSLSNSQNKPETNFTLLEHGTNVTAVFTDSFTFADKYGNMISIAAVILCIIFAAVYSKTRTEVNKDKDSDILTIDATIIAGVLILLSLQGGFKQTQITIITADIVFPFAFSVIAGLARKPVYAKTFAIVGCVNFMLSIILLIIIAFRPRL
jgi:hypothetical protein